MVAQKKAEKKPSRTAPHRRKRSSFDLAALFPPSRSPFKSLFLIAWPQQGIQLGMTSAQRRQAQVDAILSRVAKNMTLKPGDSTGLLSLGGAQVRLNMDFLDGSISVIHGDDDRGGVNIPCGAHGNMVLNHQTWTFQVFPNKTAASTHIRQKVAEVENGHGSAH